MKTNILFTPLIAGLLVLFLNSCGGSTTNGAECGDGELDATEDCDWGIEGVTNCDVDCTFFDVTTLTETSCTDGADNDGDTAIDCYDADCVNDAACPQTETVCTGGIDEDHDGATDCDDTDCSVDTVTCPVAVVTETLCGGGLDDDGDGLVDCMDSDCSTDIACTNLGSDRDGDGLCDNSAVCTVIDPSETVVNYWYLVFADSTNELAVQSGVTYIWQVGELLTVTVFGSEIPIGLEFGGLTYVNGPGATINNCPAADFGSGLSGFCITNVAASAIDADADNYTADVDCNDLDASIHTLCHAPVLDTSPTIHSGSFTPGSVPTVPPVIH